MRKNLYSVGSANQVGADYGVKRVALVYTTFYGEVDDVDGLRHFAAPEQASYRMLIGVRTCIMLKMTAA